MNDALILAKVNMLEQKLDEISNGIAADHSRMLELLESIRRRLG